MYWLYVKFLERLYWWLVRRLADNPYPAAWYFRNLDDGGVMASHPHDFPLFASGPHRIPKEMLECDNIIVAARLELAALEWRRRLITRK